MDLPFTREQWLTPGYIAGLIRERRKALDLEIGPSITTTRREGVACTLLPDGSWRVLGAAHHLGLSAADLAAVEAGTAVLDWSRRHSVALFLGAPVASGPRTV
jgi:hypothetical protein